MKFRTHTGAIVHGAELEAALHAVADDYVRSAHAIRQEDAYASHVPVEKKDALLCKHLEHAEEVRAGQVGSFAVWQRINTHLTGECVGFLPK